jgi:hypothetical protein
MRSQTRRTFLYTVGAVGLGAGAGCGRPRSGETEVPTRQPLGRAMPKAAVGVPWPPFVTNVYIVTRAESIGLFPHIHIPADHAIRLADDVDQVDWQIGLLDFGQNATLDLSYEQYLPPIELPPRPPVPTPPKPPAIPGPAAEMHYGQKGRTGLIGNSGRPSRSCTLTIDTIGTTGALWIVTDGEDGWSGGPGGDGQDGGNGKCLAPANNRAGRGGEGGTGGQGGHGSSTSLVAVVLASLAPGTVVRPVPGPTGCGRASRPSTAIGNNGLFAAWGGRGCGGPGGSPGKPGRGGAEKTGCRRGSTNWTVIAGSIGPQGQGGSLGLEGSLAPIEIRSAR